MGLNLVVLVNSPEERKKTSFRQFVTDLNMFINCCNVMLQVSVVCCNLPLQYVRRFPVTVYGKTA